MYRSYGQYELNRTHTHNQQLLHLEYGLIHTDALNRQLTARVSLLSEENVRLRTENQIIKKLHASMRSIPSQHRSPEAPAGSKADWSREAAEKWKSPQVATGKYQKHHKQFQRQFPHKSVYARQGAHLQESYAVTNNLEKDRQNVIPLTNYAPKPNPYLLQGNEVIKVDKPLALHHYYYNNASHPMATEVLQSNHKLVERENRLNKNPTKGTFINRLSDSHSIQESPPRTQQVQLNQSIGKLIDAPNSYGRVQSHPIDEDGMLLEPNQLRKLYQKKADNSRHQRSPINKMEEQLYLLRSGGTNSKTEQYNQIVRGSVGGGYHKNQVYIKDTSQGMAYRTQAIGKLNQYPFIVAGGMSQRPIQAKGDQAKQIKGGQETKQTKVESRPPARRKYLEIVSKHIENPKDVEEANK